MTAGLWKPVGGIKFVPVANINTLETLDSNKNQENKTVTCQFKMVSILLHDIRTYAAHHYWLWKRITIIFKR